MDFDDIVIGSGLSALGTVMGLSRGRRILVIGGSAIGRSVHYDALGRVPCAHLGYGGLGRYWHGVIPTGGRTGLGGSPQAFQALFHRFYPRTDLAGRLGKPWLFVPWCPIRPHKEWPKLLREKGRLLEVTNETATHFTLKGSEISVRTHGGQFRGRRLWICGGVLHSVGLIERSMGISVARRTVSDHVICYLGQIDRTVSTDIAPPRVERTRDGVWFEAWYSQSGESLCTLRPARFAFRELDKGIEQRAAYGLPTVRAISKIIRQASPALLAEALYNRTGLFPRASMQSAYAQVLVPEAYWLRGGETPLEVRPEIIAGAVAAVRQQPVWPGLIPTRQPDRFIPAIHLHHSMDIGMLQRFGINTARATVQVMDASVQANVGPEHHSFKMMLAAAQRARALTESA